MNGCFIGSEKAVLNHARDAGVILSELRNAVATDKVQTAIADVPIRKLAIAQRHGGAGCSHSSQVGPLGCHRANGSVCILESRAQRVLGIIRGVGQVGVAYCFYRDGASYLTALMTAHSVGHHRQPALSLEDLVVVGLDVAIVVFVVSAVAANIGQIGEFDTWADKHGSLVHWFLGSSEQEKLGTITSF